MSWRREVRWNAGDLSWRVGALFIVGSFLFALGSFPLYSQYVDPRADAATFALGSVFFTSAGYSQFLQALNDGSPTFRYVGMRPHDLGWWATAVQLAGTIFFNISTFGALVRGLDTLQTDKLVWAPDMFGSVAFLVASACAWVSLVGFRWKKDTADVNWWINLLNSIGSIFFMVSALAALVLPTTDEMVNVVLVNLGTFVGAACFLVGGYLLWPRAAAHGGGR